MTRMLPAAVLLAGSLLLTGCSAEPAPSPMPEPPVATSEVTEPRLIASCDELLTADDLSGFIGAEIIAASASSTLDRAIACGWGDAAEVSEEQPSLEISLQLVEDPDDGFALAASERIATQSAFAEEQGDPAPTRGEFGEQSEASCVLGGPGPACTFEGRSNGLWFALHIGAGEQYVERWRNEDGYDLEGVREAWTPLAATLVERMKDFDGITSTDSRIVASPTTCAELLDGAALVEATGLSLRDPDAELRVPAPDSAELSERVQAASSTLAWSCRLDDAGEYRALDVLIGADPWWTGTTDADSGETRALQRVVDGDRLLRCDETIDLRCTLSVGVRGAVLTLNGAQRFDGGDLGWDDPSELIADLDAVVAAYRG